MAMLLTSQQMLVAWPHAYIACCLHGSPICPDDPHAVFPAAKCACSLPMSTNIFCVGMALSCQHSMQHCIVWGRGGEGRGGERGGEKVLGLLTIMMEGVSPELL